MKEADGTTVNTNLKLLFIFIIVGLIAFTSNNVYTKTIDGIDVVLVMDSSGSMKKTDPMSLRIPAAKLFISLLNKNDRASVVSFSDKSYPIINLTPVDSEKNKDQLLKAADKISSAGLFTNLYDALAAGHDILSKENKKERSKIIVLMSDGMMDVGDPAKDRDLADRIYNEMAVALEDKGIRVYAIAFTDQADRVLLEKISKRTGGFYNLALSDKEFHMVFTSIFESLKSPDMLPMSENGFLIDGSIEEVTIVATKGSPQTQIRLNSPDGRSYSYKEKSTGIGWFVSDNFDMITIKTPAGGRWEILFSTGENNKAYIITNLKLQTNFDQLYSTFGDPLDIKIWLEKDGAAIKDQAVLDKFDIYIELTGPDGNVSKLKPFNKGEGIFVRNVAPFTPGNYKMRIVAQGNTFEREKVYVFNIADAKESKEDILLKRKKEKKADEQLKHIPVKDNIASVVSWKKVIMQFVSINLVIGIIAVVYFKRKRLLAKKGIKKIVRPANLINPTTSDKSGTQDEEKEIKKELNPQKEPPIPQEKDQREEELKQEVSEKQGQDTGPKTQAVQHDSEDNTSVIEQKEDKSQIKEIPLEEEENEGGTELGEEKIQYGQEADTGDQKQENTHKDIKKDTEFEDDNQWHEVESNQHILNQEDLNQLLGVGGKAASAKDEENLITDLKSEDRDEGHGNLRGETNNQEKIDDNIQNEEIEDMDKLWQEALQSQKDAEAGEITRGPEERINAVDLEIEYLQKGRSDEVNQSPDTEDKSIEITGRDESEFQKDETPEKMIDHNIDNEQADIDAIWQEAMQEQKAAEDGKKINKESMSSD